MILGSATVASTGLRLLDTATRSGSLEGLMILGSGTVASTGLGLLDTAPEEAILVSLAVVGLGSGSRLGCGSLGKELCALVIWSLQKLSGAICEERMQMGPSK